MILPSGEGTPGGAELDGALDSDSAPTTGLDPDTTPDAAGEQDISSTAGGTATPELAADSAAESGHEPGQPLLGDPTLDNEEEMQQARADLQSSREKTSTARDISDRLTAATTRQRRASRPDLAGLRGSHRAGTALASRSYDRSNASAGADRKG